jgi:hypothetical protein
MKTLLAVALVFSLAACKPRVEYVPTPCPPPPYVEKPVLPAASITPNTRIEDRERLLWQSLSLAVGYAVALEKIIDAYRPAQKVQVK